MDENEKLREECRVITGYLVGSSPPPELVERYVEANKFHFGGKQSDSDDAVVDFVRRRPGSLPYLDAALALLRPASLLRSKIFLMVAILEATTEFTEYFLPEPFSLPQFLWRLSRYGASISFRFIVGGLIYPFAVKAK